MIVTIDGPAGAGKSSVAKRLAYELGFRFLDTGAMYRAVTWAVLQAGVDRHDPVAAAEFANTLVLEIVDDSIRVNGRDVSQEIRTLEVTRAIGPIADNPAIRAQLVDLQRRIASQGNYVCEGRDQGSVAFPQAECKIFLTASPEHRAHRRVKELEARGIPADYGLVLKEQNQRDYNDENRPVGRLLQPADAWVLVTDPWTLDEVVAQLKAHVLERVPT